MIGRVLVRIPVRSRALRPAYQRQCTTELPLVLLSRTYATPGRPKSVVGEPSRPVKRAVKKAAAKAPTGDSAAEKKVAANKRKTATKTKTLTPEQQQRADERKAKKLEKLEKAKAADQARKAKLKVKTQASAEKEQLKALKTAALKPPKVPLITSYNLFLREKMKDHSDLKVSDPAERRANLGHASREVGREFKNLAPADLEHYNHLANSKAEEAQAEYKKWVESHSAEEIQVANTARSSLRRKLEKDRPSRKRSQWPAIHDDRAVKRPLNSYLQFSINRQSSGDFKNIIASERSKLIAQEWKALSEQEQKKYQSLGKQDSERYTTEYTEAYGHAPPVAAAAAAA